MEELTSIRLQCSSPQEVVGAINRMTALLPTDIRMRVANVYLTYSRTYGIEGVFQRMNNRSIATIFAEFDPSEDPSPIAEGEVDGMRYRLYPPPTPNTQAEEASGS